MAPGVFVVGLPLMLAKSAVPDGLKRRSEALARGPRGGVVWFRVGETVRGLASRGVRPLLGDTEKQVTPLEEPPFSTQTVPSCEE